MILPFLYAEGILQQLITTSEHHIIPPQQCNAWRVTKPQPYKALGLVISLSTEKKTQVYEITREKSPQQVEGKTSTEANTCMRLPEKSSH
jgi:hypothetical protein